MNSVDFPELGGPTIATIRVCPVPLEAGGKPARQIEGHSSIKLAKDDDGQHHYIPLDWVTSVDDRVHIDRPSNEAMREWTTTPPKQ